MMFFLREADEEMRCGMSRSTNGARSVSGILRLRVSRARGSLPEVFCRNRLAAVVSYQIPACQAPFAGTGFGCVDYPLDIWQSAGNPPCLLLETPLESHAPSQ